jgi:hypothetical protein
MSRVCTIFTEMCLLRETIKRVVVNRSNVILNGFSVCDNVRYLTCFLNLVTLDKTPLCGFISVPFPVESTYFIRMLVKFLHNRPAKFALEKAMQPRCGVEI